MSLSPRHARTALRALILLVALALVPVTRAQDETKVVEDRRPKVTSRSNMPHAGFKGVAADEAREAEQLLARGRALEEKGSYSSALRAYKKVYKEYPRSTAAPEAYYRSGQVYLAKKNLPKAFEMIDVVVRAYPNYGRFNELLAEEYRISYELIGGYRKRYFGFIPGFKNYDRGIEYFERLIQNAPYSDYAPLALMNVAQRHMKANRPEAAIYALDRLINNYPNSIVAPDAYLRLAQVHEKLVDGPLYDQGSTRTALENYEDFLILFPSDANVIEAEEGQARMREMLAQSRLKMADFYYYKRSRYQAARVFYNEAITIAPKSEAARFARERLAQVEVDEARVAAEIAAAAQGGGKRGLFGIFGGDAGGQPPPAEAPGAVAIDPKTGATAASPSDEDDEKPDPDSPGGATATPGQSNP